MASAGENYQQSNSDSGSQSTSGFAALSPQIQQVFNTLASQAGSYLQGGGNSGATTSMYTPLAQTAGETTAINNINNGFTPTAQSLQNSINMQTNPFNQSVINTINQQANGQQSNLNQQLSAAGQFGSNRAALGANDIDQTRLNTIGTFQQGNYNTALQNSLTTIPQQQLADANAQLSAGGFQRTLAGQTAQAPITGLQSIAQLLGILPTNSGQSTASSSSNAWGEGTSASFSDMRIKENITPIGSENGFPIYEFNYIGANQKYIGVMAQDIEKIIPTAVREFDGIKAVNYDMIGVKFREVQ
jgi:hypothetical protein